MSSIGVLIPGFDSTNITILSLTLRYTIKFKCQSDIVELFRLGLRSKRRRAKEIGGTAECNGVWLQQGLGIPSNLYRYC